MILRLGRPLGRLAVVADRRHRYGGSDGLDLIGAQPDAGEVPVVGQIERVTVGADLLIHLQAALRGGPVIGAEDAGEAPARVRQRLLLRQRGGDGRRSQQAGEKGETSGAHQGFSIGLVTALAGNGPPPPSTGWLMLSGSGNGRSNLPISGSSTRKCAK